MTLLGYVVGMVMAAFAGHHAGQGNYAAAGFFAYAALVAALQFGVR